MRGPKDACILYTVYYIYKEQIHFSFLLINFQLKTEISKQINILSSKSKFLDQFDPLCNERLSLNCVAQFFCGFFVCF